jgi:GxxExxY protein
MPDNKITQQTIGAAMEGHRPLGPDLLESSYQEYPGHELTIRQLNFARQKPIPLVYKEAKLDCDYRLEMLVEGRIVVELKSVDVLGAIHEAIIVLI